jgi:hypothetical protein
VAQDEPFDEFLLCRVRDLGPSGGRLVGPGLAREIDRFRHQRHIAGKRSGRLAARRRVLRRLDRTCGKARAVAEDREPSSADLAPSAPRRGKVVSWSAGMAATSANFLWQVLPFSPIFVAQFILLVVGWSMEGHAGGIRLATAATGSGGHRRVATDKDLTH